MSISQLTWYIKQVLEQAIPRVWIEGEVSDLSQPSSGHLYFSLKDDRSQVRTVVWRSTAARIPFKLKDGLSVIGCGTIDVYPPRGSYQLVLSQLQPVGIGPLQLAFQQLHRKLADQGLFDPTRKKPISKYPKRIGFVTSPSGAAVHDFLESCRERWTDFELIIIPAAVQGDAAKSDLVRGIRLAQRIRPKLDALIIGRGGGSIEDLWCFNEEAVVRAIAACDIPTVSAVGHEVDVTLSDLVADLRAFTPTHAAQLVFPNRVEILERLKQNRRRIDAQLHSRVRTMRQRLESIADRSLLARPHQLHVLRRQLLDDWETRLGEAIWKQLRARHDKLTGVVRAAEALSPLNVLARGYSLTRLCDSRSPLQSASDVTVGDAIETVLANGKLVSRVQEAQTE